MSAIGVAGSPAGVPAVQVGSLRAEYSLATAKTTGGWVAVGTVRSVRLTPIPPAWILVGMGESAPDAIADLRCQLEGQLRRIEARRN